jgi:hypothetical protein
VHIHGIIYVHASLKDRVSLIACVSHFWFYLSSFIKRIEQSAGADAFVVSFLSSHSKRSITLGMKTSGCINRHKEFMQKHFEHKNQFNEEVLTENGPIKISTDFFLKENITVGKPYMERPLILRIDF